MVILQIRTFFGAPPINYDDIVHLEKYSSHIIALAIPAVIFFALLELWYAWYTERRNFETKETISSFLIGIGNLIINFFLKVVFIYGAVFIYNLVPWRMQFNWWAFIPCLLVYDFCSYWAHRISHMQRFFWATHVVHHSSEYFNLTVSFRQSWIQFFKFIFFFPLLLLGFHPVIFFITHQIGILFQFWQHTEYIKKLHPVIEYLIITPSAHRVHHGSNEKYLDKNFGVFFAIWDRMFKTFQPEEEQPVYGLTTKVNNKIDPLYLNFHEFNDIIKDVREAKGIRKKLYYIFGNPAKIAREKKMLFSADVQNVIN